MIDPAIEKILQTKSVPDVLRDIAQYCQQVSDRSIQQGIEFPELNESLDYWTRQRYQEMAAHIEQLAVRFAQK